MSVFLFGRKLSGRFVIPSGILTTRPAIIERVARTIPEVGVLTTKSVGVEPEPGYREPILAEESPLNFVNAVGLRSPGMKTMKEELLELRERLDSDGVLNEKFLLLSIYGKTEDEFRTLIRELAPVADGFELNLSCPHSKPGYGASIGSHPDTTFSFTKAAVEASQGGGLPRPVTEWRDDRGRIPVFVKLTPNVGDIGVIAMAAVEGGASGITAINTVGPIEFRDPVSGEPVLTHITGGKSGKWIRDVGAGCVRRVREVVGPGIPIIGMGGISSARHIIDYGGADLFGVGSALAGIDLEGIAHFFRTLEKDIRNGSSDAEKHLSTNRLMEYRRFTIREVRELDHDLRVFVLDGSLEFLPGQFVFLWVPGKGEKPFSPAQTDPLTIAIRKRGIFTTGLFSMGAGETVMVRGPYGRGFDPAPWENLFILSGGTGSGAALRLAGKTEGQGKHVVVFQGCVNEKQVLFEHEFRKHGRFVTGIDRDEPGEILKVMASYLERGGVPENSVFFNIGPEVLMREGMLLESNYLPESNIYASVERETLCGVGLCGACELSGYRTCIRGTVFQMAALRDPNGGGLLL